jgi:hypothetical protein
MIYADNKDNKTKLLEDRKCPYCNEDYCGAVRMFWHLKDSHIDEIIQERTYRIIAND